MKIQTETTLTFASNSWILHHDNAPAHRALSVRECLATKRITVLEHPVYSPDLAPSDFFLFPKIKEILKGRHFDDIDDIRSNTTAALKPIPQNHFQNCFEGWTKRSHRCIASQGEYFEGDHGGIEQSGMQHFYRNQFAKVIVRPRIQELTNSITYDHFDLYKSTRTSSDMMRIYRPQYDVSQQVHAPRALSLNARGCSCKCWQNCNVFREAVQNSQYGNLFTLQSQPDMFNETHTTVPRSVRLPESNVAFMSPQTILKCEQSSTIQDLHSRL